MHPLKDKEFIEGWRDRIPVLRREKQGKRKTGKNISFFIWKGRLERLTLSSQKQKETLLRQGIGGQRSSLKL